MPGMIAGILGYNFLNSCTNLTVDGTSVKAVREIDGGKETVATTLPLIIGGQRVWKKRLAYSKRLTRTKRDNSGAIDATVNTKQ
jgi:electron transfer flavoprotein beta subunit